MARKKTSKSMTTRKPQRMDTIEGKAAAKHAEDGAKVTLLQLNLGRTAQMYGIYSAFTLALCAFIVTIGNSTLGFRDIPIFRDEYFLWIITLVVGMILSLAVVLLKLGPYGHEKTSGHYIMSFLATGLCIALLVIVLLHASNQFVLQYTTWLYPTSVLGMSLTLVSLAATWEGSSRRKLTSILAAIMVPVFFLFALSPFPTTEDFKRYLVLVYLFGALAYAISGSLLLMIATATEAHEREIVKAGDIHLALLKGEYERRREAVDYKERAIRAQEAHLESREIELRSYEEEIAERKKAVEQTQLKMDAQWKDMKDLERQLTVMKTDLQTKAEALVLKEKSVKEHEKDLERVKDGFKNRETQLLEREKELKRDEIDLAEKVRKSEEKLNAVAEAEARLKTETGEIETRRNELIQREKDMELKESDVQMRIERLQAIEAPDSEVRIRELKDWEDKLALKERELAKLEVDVRKLDKEMRIKAEDTTVADARLQQQRLHMADKEKDLLSREKQLSDLEMNLAQRARQIEQQQESIKASNDKLESKEKEYEGMFRTLKEMEATISKDEEHLWRQREELDAERERAKLISENLSKEVKALNEKHKKLRDLARELEQREGDLGLKVMELEKQEKAMVQMPTSPAVDDEREKVIELRERRLREREDEFRRMMYQKEKELEALETAVKEKERRLAVTAGEEVQIEESVTVEDEERIQTGIPRLDDLLYGGIKKNSMVMLLGPAFIGKEIVAMNFLAEGLRKGVPAIILTTTKPPVEISKDIAPILPSFMEYEQHGLVWWIDASGSLQQGSKPVKEGNKYRVNGATDFQNIIEVIDNLDSEFHEKKYTYFRLVYMSLSSSTTQADERVAVGFVQKLVNRLRQMKAISMLTLEKGMHTDQQLETLEHLMDGIMQFKTEKNKNLLSIIGLGEVQTREWVPYKFTNKSLIIGAFRLERIK